MKKIVLISGLALIPGIAFAQNTIAGIATNIGELITAITPVIVALALLYFFWGLEKYILAAGDESAQADGKKIMIWGIIALFVIVSGCGVPSDDEGTVISDETGEVWEGPPCAIGVNNHKENGTCYCDEGFSWCDENTSLDCCESS